MKTQAIIFPEPNKITFGEVEVPDPEPGDVVVRTTHTLLSTGTDTRTLRGGQSPDFPLVPSYSALGVVEETHGDCGRVREGDLVFHGTPKALIGINRCWGAQVARAVRPAAGLVPLDERRSPEEYAFTKVAAIALHGVRRSMSRPGDSVLVLGQGRERSMRRRRTWLQRFTSSGPTARRSPWRRPPARRASTSAPACCASAPGAATTACRCSFSRQPIRAGWSSTPGTSL